MSAYVLSTAAAIRLQQHVQNPANTSRAFLALVGFALMFWALRVSKRKLHSLLFIVGWTVATAVAVAAAALSAAMIFRFGDPPAFAGTLSGTSILFALLFTSMNRIRAARRERLNPTRT